MVGAGRIRRDGLGRLDFDVFVDDTLYFTYVNEGDGWRSWPYDHPFHLILNVAVGGNWPGYPDASSEFPQEMVVDYVRVYQRPEFPECELLFDGMDYDIGSPNRRDQDLISYSAGHKAMGLYAMWALRDEVARIARPDLLPNEENLRLRFEDLLYSMIHTSAGDSSIAIAQCSNCCTHRACVSRNSSISMRRRCRANWSCSTPASA